MLSSVHFMPYESMWLEWEPKSMFEMNTPFLYSSRIKRIQLEIYNFQMDYPLNAKGRLITWCLQLFEYIQNDSWFLNGNDHLVYNENLS